MNNPIKIQVLVAGPIELVWTCWNSPEHIIKWNAANDDWHTPAAVSDFRIGGSFSYRMEAKDGSMGFDLNGKFDQIEDHRYIAYTMEDDRKVAIEFEARGDRTLITEQFEAESMNSRELQEAGWQAILNNFAKYTSELHSTPS